MESQTNAAVLKALDILDLLGQSAQPLALREIAQLLAQPESTTHRLLASLAARGYVRQTGQGTYFLGWKLVTLAQALGDLSRLPQLLRPQLQDLVRQVGHAVNLAVLNQQLLIYLDCQTPLEGLSVYTAPGSTAPVHATAAGKVLLAHLPESERNALCNQLTLSRYTARTLTTLTDLQLELAEIQARGYALDREEYFEGVTCIAAPLLDSRKRAIATISLTMHAADLPADWETQYAPRLRTTCQAIAKQLYG
jgi:DNA-binding IclR family transcriptional regulator